MEIISSIESDYLLIKITARLANEDDLLIHAKKIYEEIIKTDKTKILLDQVHVQFATNLFLYYTLVQSYVDDYPPEARFLKIANVISENFITVGHFWETVAQNRGFKFRAFTSFSDAVEWLLS